ncbi:MAG: hypothetical protein ACRDF7_04150 [Candidatus Limnocylindrales bacterium]
MDQDLWRRWVASVVQAQADLDAAGALLAVQMAGREPHQPNPADAARAGAFAQQLRRPGDLCPGSGLLHERLEELWAEYRGRGDLFTRRMNEPAATHRRSAHLWELLEPFHDRLPSLSVFLVDYPSPVVMPVPPAACLISPSPRDFSGKRPRPRRN